MKYTWGDPVYLKKIDGNGTIASKVYAEVVSLNPIETEQQAKAHSVPIGSNFYTIEFSDGSDDFVSEDSLEPYTKTLKEIRSNILELSSEDAYGSWELWGYVIQDVSDKDEKFKTLQHMFIQVIENLIFEKKIVVEHYTKDTSYTPAVYEKTRLKYEIDNSDKPDPDTFYWFSTTEEGKDEDIEVRFIKYYCTSNKEQLAKSKIAGCFYCLKIFDPKEIENWNSDKKGDTAICPYCVIDSVYGDASGREVSKENLEKLHKRWFK